MRVFIIDDNRTLAKLLVEKIEMYEGFEVKYIGSNGLEGLGFLSTRNENELPHVILMDLEMPVMDGIQTIFEVNRKYPQIKILVFTVFDNDEKIFQAIQAGASGYFLKDEKIQRIIEGLEEINSGGAPMSPFVATRILFQFRNQNQEKQASKPESFNLTSREIEILELLVEGKTNKLIAEKLFISSFTAKKHVENIYQKLHVSSRAELTHLALKNKWV